MPPALRALGVAAVLFVILWTTAVAARPGRPPAPATQSPTRLRIEGRAFFAGAARFSWRGLTAFQLVEMIAHGRAAQAEELLDWASGHGVTVVRVLSMARVLFQLAPAEGRAALPRLLSLAAARGLYVEVVALADTDRFDLDLDEQVRSVGAICDAHANCVLEIANEPAMRQTQRAGLGDPKRLLSLRRLVPARVPVSIGSGPTDDSDAWAVGDYVTVHLSRDDGDRGWATVLRMTVAEATSRRTGKPVVDDEPIGAGPKYEPGRRDDDPTRWQARGMLARLMGLGTTFHFEAGLHALKPEGREAACFDAWRRGLESLPPDLESRTSFREAGPDAAVVAFDRSKALEVYVAENSAEAWAVAVGTTGDPRLRWREGWRPAATEVWEGLRLVKGSRW